MMLSMTNGRQTSLSVVILVDIFLTALNVMEGSSQDIQFNTTSSFAGREVRGEVHEWAVGLPSLTLSVATSLVAVRITSTITVTLTLANSTTFSGIVFVFSDGSCDANPSSAPFLVTCEKPLPESPLLIKVVISDLSQDFNESKLNMVESGVVSWNYPTSEIILKYCDSTSDGTITNPATCAYDCITNVTCTTSYQGSITQSRCAADAMWNPQSDCTLVTTEARTSTADSPTSSATVTTEAPASTAVTSTFSSTTATTESSGPSGGAIAGIVILVLAVIASVIVVLWCCGKLPCCPWDPPSGCDEYRKGTPK